MGDGGSGGDPENRAQNLQSRLGKLLRINPTRAGSAWQIVGYGAAEPVAVLVRPRERRPLDRRRRPGQRGRRSTTAPRRRVGKLANYGWSRYEGTRDLRPEQAVRPQGRRRVAGQWVYSHADGCSITGGYVYRGSSVPAAARALLLRRLLQRHGLELQGRASGRASATATRRARSRASPRSARTGTASSTPSRRRRSRLTSSAPVSSRLGGATAQALTDHPPVELVRFVLFDDLSYGVFEQATL